jgi:hypothetical protein
MKQQCMMYVTKIQGIVIQHWFISLNFTLGEGEGAEVW